MAIDSKYAPQEIEAKWYAYWLEKRFFNSSPNQKPAYTIVIPPPNVTGVLHMGHMLNNTIQDVLIRKARMQGFNACWVPGTDHASIATEAKVVQKLKAEGIEKRDISREEFLSHAWAWTHKHGGIILEQLKRLGASCDWEREVFTMDEIRNESVNKVFCDLYNDGLIYKGYKMVNWDPEARTTVSDEEVIHKEVNGTLYYLKYHFTDQTGYLRVATTRPETIFGDVAVCVNPTDERYAHLIGKKVVVPICNREVEIIADEYVDPAFGTGCLKITPAHDINDYQIGVKHQLEILDVFTEEGKLNAHGLQYEGLDRFVVRKQIAKALEELNLLEKAEDYKTSVGTSERTGAVIEPRLSMQWFLSMEKLSEPALKAVMDDVVKLIPAKFKNTYKHWMENVRDWNISRQLYWGHRIPVWYINGDKNDFVVAMNLEEAVEKATAKTGQAITANELQQEEDVLDTWFSSWLWPLSVFDGIRNPNNDEIKYYYPTATLVSAPEILFFWIARMIIVGYYYRNEKPFEHVYLTGIVRDKQGRKMSKSLGNSPDPIALIENHGADGVRVGMLLTSPAGNDLPFDEGLCVQGRNFVNKIWNAYRLVEGWTIDYSAEQPKHSTIGSQWLQHKINAAIQQSEDLFAQFRISEALMLVYKTIWDDFCSAYLEIIKPAFGQPIDHKTFNECKHYFEQLLKILHPFAPFATEEIWQALTEGKHGESICVADYPTVSSYNEELIKQTDFALEIVAQIRNYRAKQGLSPKESIALSLLPGNDFETSQSEVIIKLANLASLELVNEQPESSNSILVGKTQLFIPVAQSELSEAQKAEMENEIGYLQGFLKSVRAKLSNEKFVNGAPAAVIEKERQKEADAVQKIEALKSMLGA